MRILHVIPSFAPAWYHGGPIYAAFGLTRALVQQGHKVTVMTTNINGPGVIDVPLGQPVLMDGVEVWYFPLQWPRAWCFSRPLGCALRQQIPAFDLVHIHSIFLWPTSAAAFWCRRFNVPYLLRPATVIRFPFLHRVTTPIELTHLSHIISKLKAIPRARARA